MTGATKKPAFPSGKAGEMLKQRANATTQTTVLAGDDADNVKEVERG
jgi:hypothetical protein